MHKAIGAYIQHQMKEAHEFVRNRIEVKLSADEVYEGLIGNSEITAAFANATQYLPPRSLDTSTYIHYGERSAQRNRMRIMLRLPPTEKYRQRFIPEHPLVVTPQSDLGKFFAKQIAITNEWNELEYVFDQLFVGGVTVMEIAFLMRFVRELIAECNWSDEPEIFLNRWNGKVSKQDMRTVDREMRIINSHVTPNHFPILTKRVSDICKNGKALFGQYRILKSVAPNQEQSPITLFDGDTLMGVDQDLQDDMLGVMLAWRTDVKRRDDETHQRRVDRFNTKWLKK